MWIKRRRKGEKIKRKFLKDLKLEEETIDRIADEHGKDVAKLITERDNFKNQYETAQTALKGFEGVDVNEPQTKISMLNTRLVNKDTEWQRKLDELEFSDLLKDTVRGTEAHNDKTVIALLNVANLGNSKDRQVDITTALEIVKKDNAYLFQGSGTPYVVSRAEGPNQNTASQKDQTNAAFRSLFGKEQVMSVNITNRQDAETLIREQVVSTIFQDTPRQSIFMGVACRLLNMTGKQTRTRILGFLPTAYWMNDDIGMKQTTRQVWDNVYLTAGKLAVIMPIPEVVLGDIEFDIMGEITSRVNEAIGQYVNSTITFGYNHPAEWQSNIITLARQTGDNVADTGDKGLYDKLLGEGGVFSKVEEDGYMVGGCPSALGMRVKLRGLRTTDGTSIFKSDMQGSTPYALDGTPICFPTNGNCGKNIAQLIAGDFKQAVYTTHRDITVEILDQGVIQDPVTKEIVHDLAQRDMVVLRIIFRMGWALPNTATRLDENRTGCAFAYLEPATPYTAQGMTFTIKGGNGEDANPVEKARADVSGAKLMTGADGTVEFNLHEGTYPVKVTKKDHTMVNDTVVVVKDTVTKDTALIKNQ